MPRMCGCGGALVRGHLHPLYVGDNLRVDRERLAYLTETSPQRVRTIERLRKKIASMEALAASAAMVKGGAT